MFSSAFGLNSSDSDMEGELRELIGILYCNS